MEKIHVRYILTFDAALQPSLRLHFDTLKPALERSRDQVENLRATDGAGILRFKAPVEEPGHDSLDQIWESARAVRGTLTIEYDVPAAVPIATKRGPHVDLQAAGGGISGAFSSFLLLPDLNESAQFRVHWVLSAGETAVSTLGVGDFATSATMRALRTALFLAGPVRSYPSPPTAGGISFHALGVPETDLAALAGWSTQLYAAELTAFRGDPAKPFRFLIRSYDGGPTLSGRADDGVFMLYLPHGSHPEPAALHELIAHEAVHALIRDLDDAPGDEGDWYTEGTADYFAILIPQEARLVDPCETLALINREAALYYTNALRAEPNDRLTQVMWSGRNAWTVPYARGALYLAGLDAELRDHHLPLRVKDLVNETSRRITAGAPADNGTWEGVLHDKVGTWAVAQWRTMLSGALLTPGSGSYDAQFRAMAIHAPFFDLGFDRPKAIAAGARIEGLHTGSPAYRAGLRDGDVVSESLDLNPAYRAFDQPVTLQVERSGLRKAITFDPHEGSYPGVKWTLTGTTGPADVPGTRCPGPQ